MFSYVSLSQLLEFFLPRKVSVMLHWLPLSPPSNHLQQPYWLTPHLSKFSPSTLSIDLDSWTLKMRPISCHETSVRKYRYSLRNNPEECSPQCSNHAVCQYIKSILVEGEILFSKSWRLEVLGKTFLTHKGKAILLQPWTGPECSKTLRLPDFKTIGTWRW